MTDLVGHLETHREYFLRDARTIAEAELNLNPNIHELWRRNARSITGNITWIYFCDFLRTTIKNAPTPEMAMKQYNVAKQQDNQTVRSFANYLARLEDSLDKLITDRVRVQRLWDAVLPEVQAAVGHTLRPYRYEDNIILLQEAEKGSRIRREALGEIPPPAKRRREG